MHGDTGHHSSCSLKLKHNAKEVFMCFQKLLLYGYNNQAIEDLG